MKRIVLILIIGGLSVACADAQNLYKTVMERATDVINNPASMAEDVSICQFKIAALNYIMAKMKEMGMQKDPYFYDSQAVNLESFLADYKENLGKAKAVSAAKAAEITKVYKEATLSNPLVNDADKEKVNANVNAASKTPFSLDTNWENAYDEATRKAKAVLK